MIAPPKKAMLTAFGLLLAIAGIEVNISNASGNCDTASIRQIEKPKAGDSEGQTLTNLNLTIQAIKNCLVKDFSPVALTMYKSSFSIDAGQWNDIKFEDVMNESPGSGAMYSSGVFIVPHEGLYAVSLFGRINSFLNQKSSLNDVFMALQLNEGAVDNSHIFVLYKGQGIRRDSISGSAFVELKKGDKLKFKSQLTGNKSEGVVLLDHVYMSIAKGGLKFEVQHPLR
jgi:hypothetical protein